MLAVRFYADYEHRAYLPCEAGYLCPFVKIPGFNLHRWWVDSMHAVCLGTVCTNHLIYLEDARGHGDSRNENPLAV